MKKPSISRGFTLAEIMIAMSIFALLMSMLMSFYLQSLRTMYASDQRMKLAAQIKKFSNELIVQASRSNQFVLYKSPTPADFDGTNAATYADNSDRQIILGNDNDDASSNPAGDFVVFIYYEIPKPTTEAQHRILKLEGFFLSTATPGEPGKVTKVLIDLSTAPSTATIESILTAKWAITSTGDPTRAQFTDYFPMVRGLAKPEVVDGVAITTATNPQPAARLFYMTRARNVIISGQIFSSIKDLNTKNDRTYTNSFCFNITPRT